MLFLKEKSDLNNRKDIKSIETCIYLANCLRMRKTSANVTDILAGAKKSIEADCEKPHDGKGGIGKTERQNMAEIEFCV